MLISLDGDGAQRNWAAIHQTSYPEGRPFSTWPSMQEQKERWPGRFRPGLGFFFDPGWAPVPMVWPAPAPAMVWWLRCRAPTFQPWNTQPVRDKKPITGQRESSDACIRSFFPSVQAFPV